MIASLTLIRGLMAVSLALLLAATAPAAAEPGNGVPFEELVEDLQDEVAALQTLLACFSRSGDEVYITGCNLNLRDGSGGTHDGPNGLGNLILGYDEVAGIDPTPFRTGSHDLVLGQGQAYPSFGGLLAGRRNTVPSTYGSIAGGEHGFADAAEAAILGGMGNIASTWWNAIGGGEENAASGQFSWVSGGQSCTSSGPYTSVGGGLSRAAPGSHDWAAGGLLEDQ